MVTGLDRWCDGGESLSHAKRAWGERLHRTTDLLVSWLLRICPYRGPASRSRSIAAAPSRLLVMLPRAAAAVLLGWAVSGCSEGPAAPGGERTAAQEVGVIELQPTPLAVVRELPGRITPTRIAEVRAGYPGSLTTATSSREATSRRARSSTRSTPSHSRLSSTPRKRP